MRRIGFIVCVVAMTIALPGPAFAYAHDRVADPWLHMVLDVMTLAMVTSPLWTAYWWDGSRRLSLLLLIGIVQIPAAVFAFVPIADPVLHLVALVVGLTLTGSSLWYVRTATSSEEVAPLPRTDLARWS